MMSNLSIALGISHLAFCNPPAGATLQSGCSSFGSHGWKENTFTKSFSLRVRANSGGRSSRQVQLAGTGEGILATKGLSAAEYVADGGLGVSEDDSVRDVVPVGSRGGGGGGGGLRAAPLRSTGRFWRRFPDAPQGGSEDVTVPMEALRRGAVFKGTVSSVQPFGAFVKFGAFADGLVHISKLSSGYVANVSDVVELGQEVMVSIVNVEESTGRISLSLMEKDEMDRRKPYLSPRLEEARQRGEGSHFGSGSGRSALTVGEREERGSKGSYALSSRSMDPREGGGRPRYQPGSGRISHSMREEEQERFSSNPNASSRHREARGGGGGERPRFQPGFGLKSRFVGEEEEEIPRNPFVSSRFGEAGEGDRVSKNSFASPRNGQFRGEDRQSRNSFASPRNGQFRGEDRQSRTSFASPRNEEFRGEGRQSRNPFTPPRNGEFGGEDRQSRNSFPSPRNGEFGGEDRQSRNPFASSRNGEFGGEDRQSRNPFASPRNGEFGGGDSQSRNPFASSRQGEAREEDRTLRNSPIPSLRREAGDEGSSDRYEHQGIEGNLKSRITRVGKGADREEQAKPKMRLVQIQSDVKSVEDKVSSGMRNVMRSWYGCDCC